MSKLKVSSSSSPVTLVSYGSDQKDRSDASMSGSCKKEDVIKTISSNETGCSYLSALPEPASCNKDQTGDDRLLGVNHPEDQLSTTTSESSSAPHDHRHQSSSCRRISTDSLAVNVNNKTFLADCSVKGTHVKKDAVSTIPLKAASSSFNSSKTSAHTYTVPSRALRQGCSRMTRSKSQLSFARGADMNPPDPLSEYLEVMSCQQEPRMIHPPLFASEYPVHTLCVNCLKNYKRKEEEFVMEIQTERNRMMMVYEEIDRLRRRKKIRSNEKVALIVILLINVAFFVTFCFLGLLFLKTAKPP